MNSTVYVSSRVFDNDRTDYRHTLLSFILPKSIQVNKYINYSYGPYSESKNKNLKEELTNIEEYWLDTLPSNKVYNMLRKFSSVFENIYYK